MNTLKHFMRFVLCTVLFSACLAPPDYPPIPQIELVDLRFINHSDQPDSLILVLSFKDGDGDLGLQSRDTTTVIVDGKRLFFSEKIYYLDETGERISYKHKRTRPELNLPDYVKPYTCTNWEIVTVNNSKDTLYFNLNRDHYNIFVDFYVKQDNGTFQRFNWVEEFCTTFDGRFPVLAKDLNMPTTLEGELQYSMVSSGFELQFSGKTLKLNVQIQDRKQQKSNIIETPEFQFR